MLQKLTLTLFSALMIFCSVFVQAKELSLHHDYGSKLCKKEVLSKIFTTPDQILITSDGIFVYTASKKQLLSGKFIAIEDGEVYVAVSDPQFIPKRGPCGLHKPWHTGKNGCYGCGILGCPMNCTCFD